ncbi:anhydro-N-acetylmuramic acid kinase [Poriferisphaera sp. WC338]|uniref:anhydro-N-acetylmuramic acid kinase n=1 Tax=Poriferisphaera sp. WC338 TaxID=3425129 RepID=UPI003D81823D
MKTQQERYVIGCMTGTSLDGLDAALVRIVGQGMQMHAEFMGMASHELGELADILQEMTTCKPFSALDFMRTARQLGELHAKAAEDLSRKCLPEGKALDMIVCHGQTVWHAPADKIGKLSWQLFDPYPVVRHCGVKVCFDLRQADLIAGGEGAPITCASDWIIYRQPNRRQHIFNLGGICNITSLTAGAGFEGVTGGDRGPSNILIDGMVQRLFGGLRYDHGGELARKGKANNWIVDLLKKDVFGLQAKGKITLGREDFDEAFFNKIVELRPDDFTDHDVIAACAEAVAHVVVDSVKASDTGNENIKSSDKDGQVILAGGGAKNDYLVERIKALMEPGYEVCRSDEVGIPVDGREAMGFAILGALSEDGIPVTLSQITGSDNPGRAGSWVYP